MERVGRQEDIVAKGAAARPHALRDPDHRLDDRAGGEDRRGPGRRSPGSSTTGWPSACRCRSTPRRLLRHAAGGSTRTCRSPSCARSTRRRTRTSTRACRRRRSPTRAGRRSRRRSTRRRTRASGDPICADLPDADAVQVPLLRARRRGRQPRLRRDARAARGERADARRAAGAARTDHRRDARRRGDRLAGAALAVAGDAQRRVRRRRARLGVRRVRGGAGRRRARRSTAMRALGIGGLSVTMPHKERRRRGRRRARPGGRGAAVGQHRRAARRRAARRPQHRRRRLRRRRCAADGVDVDGARVAVLGAGGAARSVVDALGRAGAADDRRRQPHGRARPPSAAALAPAARGRHRSATSPAPTSSSTPRRSGMGTDELPFDPALLHPARSSPTSSTTRCDTALLRAAASAGCAHRRRARDARPPGRAPAAAVARPLPDVAVMRAAAEPSSPRRPRLERRVVDVASPRPRSDRASAGSVAADAAVT